MQRAWKNFLGKALILVALTAPCLAEDGAGRVPVPHPPKGQGDHCVADTAFMRRYHMMMLVDHRKDAVHQGVRTPQYSLAGCVSCHAVKGEDGQPVSFASEKHFCRSCHSYAAVKIDCFECHASRPETPAKAADSSAPPGDADAERLAAFLRETNLRESKP
jgi:hypothetical protein